MLSSLLLGTTSGVWLCAAAQAPKCVLPGPAFVTHLAVTHSGGAAAAAAEGVGCCPSANSPQWLASTGCSFSAGSVDQLRNSPELQPAALQASWQRRCPAWRCSGASCTRCTPSAASWRAPTAGAATSCAAAPECTCCAPPLAAPAPPTPQRQSTAPSVCGPATRARCVPGTCLLKGSSPRARPASQRWAWRWAPSPQMCSPQSTRAAPGARGRPASGTRPAARAGPSPRRPTRRTCSPWSACPLRALETAAAAAATAPG